MSPVRVLVAVNDPALAADLRGRLADLGYPVAGTAASADEAARLADEARPDVVLAGADLAEAVGRRHGVPVVQLGEPAGHAADPFGYVARPFEGRELAVVIEAAAYRTAARRELRDRDRWLEAAVRDVADAVVTTDPAGRVTSLNPEAERLTGWAREEAVGRGVDEVYRPVREGTREAADNPLWRSLRERADVPLTNHTAVVARRGGERPIDDRSAPVVGDRGELLGGVLVFRDLSEDRRVGEQLRQARRLEAVGRVAGAVAHDFNNLLTVINGYCQTLLETLRPGDPTREMVEEVLGAGERAAGLTKQLLTYSRQQRAKPGVTDLNALLGRLRPMLGRVVGEGVRLAVELGPDPARAEVDPAQAEQVVMNLVSNARDAMPDGGTLAVRTRGARVDGAFAARFPDAIPGEYVVLTVADTGRGIDPEARARLFEPYFTTKEPGKGTGLGLPTVAGVARSSGGFVDVRSEPGRGTEFDVYFPLTHREVTAGPPARPSVGLPRGTETVLLVDDEAGVRTLAAHVLRLAGYTVLEAASAAQAIDLNDRHPGPIHLLVTDVQMPRMGGRELAGLLRDLRPGLRVLYVSGLADEPARADEPGAGLLAKPFTPSDLARAVRAALGDAVPVG